MTAYVVALSKGGSTKTTTAAELVAGLARAGRRVVAIDLDQQGNLSTRLGITPQTEVGGVAADVLTGQVTAADAAVASPTVPGAHVIVGSDDLTGMDGRPEIMYSLRGHMPEILSQWDDVVIDTPPALGVVTLAGLVAADVVVAAVACEGEAYDQLGRLVTVIEEKIARTKINADQTVRWIVPTRYDPRRLLDRDVLELLRTEYGDRVTLPVREAVAARDAYSAGMPVSVYAPESPVSVSYEAALAPVLAASLTRVTTLTNSTMEEIR